MKRINRSLVTVAIAGGLCCGIGAVRAQLPGNSPAANRLDDDHYKYAHMHHAMEKLKTARHELDQAEDAFAGHKAEALAHVDSALDEIKTGLKEQHDESAIPGVLASARNLDGDHYPHMHAALDRLREGRDELNAADPIFQGHRDKAIKETEKAIKQLEDALGG